MSAAGHFSLLLYYDFSVAQAGESSPAFLFSYNLFVSLLQLFID